MSDSVPTSLTIAQTAERSGLSADTLRYYERIGLVDPVPRTSTGNRAYGDAPGCDTALTGGPAGRPA